MPDEFCIRNVMEGANTYIGELAKSLFVSRLNSIFEIIEKRKKQYSKINVHFDHSYVIIIYENSCKNCTFSILLTLMTIMHKMYQSYCTSSILLWKRQLY